MNRPLVATLTMAALSGGSAMAQSSVTIFGVLDTTVQHASQGGATSNRVLGLGGNQFSRIGFRGVEDLGGGLSAGFTLDAGMNVNTGAGGATTLNNQTAFNPGALLFSRRSTVSLFSKSLGELRLGRDFVPTYWNLTVFDPFGTAGAGAVTNIAQSALTRVSTVQTAVRASNTVGYFLPTGLAGVYGQAMYALGNNASNAPGGTANDGRYVGARVGYAAGPVNVAIAHAKTTLAAGDVTTTNLGASYRFGPALLMAQYFRDSKDAPALPNRSHGFLVGGQWTIGAGYIPVSYTTVKNNTATGQSANQIAVGYVHNLSKRTALYGTFSRIENKNGAALTGGGVAGVADASWRAIDLGIRHSF